MKLKLTLLTFFIYCSVSGQQTSPLPNSVARDLSRTQAMSPQTADFVKYDNTSVTETSGRLDLSIPVLDFDDPDFDFPISLTYNSAGFKPSEPDNFVGRNWTLDFGGMIYREVRGVPDETANLREYGLNGFLTTVRLGQYDNWAIYDNVLTNPWSILGYSELSEVPSMKGNEHNEFSSDIYHFRFGNHSGKFMINFDGTVNIISYDGGSYSVDLSKFFPLNNNENGFSCEISISTDDGYRYFFGGSYKSLEYVAHSWSNSDLVPAASAQTTVPASLPEKGWITGFYLSRIIAPNGRELTIQYRGNLPQEYISYPYRLINNKISRAKEYCQEFTITSSPYRIASIDSANYIGVPRQFFVNGQASANIHYGNNYVMIKAVVPERITTDDKDIFFHYSARKHTTLENDKNLFLNGKYCGTVLDSIVLQRSGCSEPAISVTRLSYSYTSGNCPRMFLSSVQNARSGKFLFSYNSTGSLPEPQTTNIDHWGYWRGDISNRTVNDRRNSELIPKTNNLSIGTYDSPNWYFYTSDNREATGSLYDAGLLSSVTFPTGGTEVIAYEPNSYSRKYTYGMDWFPHLALCDEPKLAGGARVHCISLYDRQSAANPKLCKRTWYSYKTHLSDKKSSGILLFEPRYIHQSRSRHNFSGKQGFQYFVTENSDGFNARDYDTDHIMYSSVIKQEESSRTYRPDSSSHLVLSPNSPDKEPIFKDVSVCANTKQVWTFYGRASNGGTCSAYILDRTTKTKIKKYTFSSNTTDSISFSPADSIAAGDYTIALKKVGNALAGFRERFPGSGVNDIEGRITINTYTDIESNPDIFSDADSYWNKIFSLASLMPSPKIDSSYLKRAFLKPIDHSQERGLLKKHIVLSSSNSTKLIEDYTYSRISPDKTNLYINVAAPACGAPTAQYFQLCRVPMYMYLPVSKIVTESDSTGSNSIATEYSYQKNGYLSSARTSYADGTEDLSQYRYIDDESSAYNDILKLQNVRSYPVSIENRYSTLNISSECTEKSYAYEVNAADSSSVVLSDESDFINGNKTSSVKYLKFDKYSNPIHVLTDSISNTVYLWSYLGKHLVAKIENATYKDVAEALDCKPETISESLEPDCDKLDSLRVKLRNSLVWTYKWKPLVGMISETSPNGFTKYYDYDETGRLTEVYILHNGKKEIIEAYEYHLVNQ